MAESMSEEGHRAYERAVKAFKYAMSTCRDNGDEANHRNSTDAIELLDDAILYWHHAEMNGMRASMYLLRAQTGTFCPNPRRDLEQAGEDYRTALLKGSKDANNEAAWRRDREAAMNLLYRLR